MLISNWILASALTLFISGGLAGYGAFLARYLKNALSGLALGIGLATTLGLVTGLMGFYDVSTQTAIIVVGWLLLIVHRRALTNAMPSFVRHDLVWLAFPGLYGLVRLVSDGLPHQHSDPLYYHLLAPKLWAEWGRIKLLETHPSFAQATLWELIYGWARLLSPAGVSGNVTTQIASQCLHFIWGQLGCIAVGAALVTRGLGKARLPTGAKVFLAWLCVSTPALEWTGTVAKNDYVLCLFLLTALLSALDRRAGSAGALIGLAFATKFFAFWTALALLVLIPPRLWLRYVGAGLATSLPILLRNAIFTGNPFFPALDDVLGPGWLSDAWNTANKTFAGAPDFTGLAAMISTTVPKLFPRPLPYALLLVGALGWTLLTIRARRTALKRELSFIAVQFGLALLILKPEAEGRYAAPILVMLFLLFVPVVFAALPWLANHRSLYASLALGLLVNIPLDVLVKVPRQYLFAPRERYLEQFHPRYKLFAWVNAEIPREKRILFFNEKINYYLDRDFEAASEMRRWERVYSDARNARELLQTIRGHGYDYFHFYRDVGEQAALLELRHEANLYREQAVLFDEVSVILDLTRVSSNSILDK